MSKAPKHPMQPLEYDAEGVLRFKPNAIVEFMVDAGRNGWKFDLNMLATMRFSDDDWTQLAQLIGYSLSGFGDLPYVNDEAYNAAEAAAQSLQAQSESTNTDCSTK